MSTLQKRKLFKFFKQMLMNVINVYLKYIVLIFVLKNGIYIFI